MLDHFWPWHLQSKLVQPFFIQKCKNSEFLWISHILSLSNHKITPLKWTVCLPQWVCISTGISHSRWVQMINILLSVCYFCHLITTIWNKHLLFVKYLFDLRLPVETKLVFFVCLDIWFKNINMLEHASFILELYKCYILYIHINWI